MHHYLRPLLAPASIALVGASDRPGSLGRVVLENIIGGEYAGALHLVNPNHRKILGRRAVASLAKIRQPVDLALIAVPPAAVVRVLADAARVQLRSAVLMTAPPAVKPAVARKWAREVSAAAAKHGVRLIGPGAFGVIRTDLALNATVSDIPVLPGRLALLAQSGAVCTAMLDFAAPFGIGFSSVISLGGGVDVGFGELLDALVVDPGTDAILLYIEEIGDARPFLSALRAAARSKPVVVLKAGRSLDRPPRAGAFAPDAVFESALRRAGTVRVHTYTQLFAAARILATGRIAQGDRLAIVANGRGPALLAADSAQSGGVKLAELAAGTIAALDNLLPEESARSNPVDVRGDAPPDRLAAAVGVVLRDPGVDAVLALHVPRPNNPPTDAARAVAAEARASDKPVLAAWLGSVERPDLRGALEAGGIANFYTPETAVEAFSFLAAYRRNQGLLLEVPPPYAALEPPDLETAERIRAVLAADGRRVLRGSETHALLSAFRLPLSPIAIVSTLTAAHEAARGFHFPVTLLADLAPPAPARRDLGNGRALARAWDELQREAATFGGWNGQVLVFRAPHLRNAREVALGIGHDATFGPVIGFGASRHSALAGNPHALMLPPLNQRLATDLVCGSLAAASAPDCMQALAPLSRLLQHLSTLACELPWVRELSLDPVLVTPEAALIGRARVVAASSRRVLPRYGHMAIHPYPAELDVAATLRDGSVLQVRPIRPEDAVLEQRFVSGLSEESRYFRFFYQLHQLTPQMLARFTQVDYDRELALVALASDPGAPGGQGFVGVARYVQNPDRESAEFAVVVSDAWQGRGVAWVLMERLIACAKRRGIARLEGAVLRANTHMLRFCERLGFTAHEDPDDPDQVTMVRVL